MLITEDDMTIEIYNMLLYSVYKFITNLNKYYRYIFEIIYNGK